MAKTARRVGKPQAACGLSDRRKVTCPESVNRPEDSGLPYSLLLVHPYKLADREAALMSVTEDKFYRVRIIQRKDFASDLWMIRVQAGGEFKFAPGQYATLGVERQEKRSERPYSIVSSPYESELEFFFELVPQGELTPDIYKLHVGDEMLM